MEHCLCRDYARGRGSEPDCDPDDRRIWRAVNPASFVTVEALRKQRNSPAMTAATFKRLHLNAWVAPDQERWIPNNKWDACACGAGIPAGATIYVGADGSRSYDTTCIAWAHASDDGTIAVDAKVFCVRADIPHHVLHEGTIDFDDVEQELLALAERFNVVEVRFDPRYLMRSMEVLSDRLPAAAVVPVEPFSRHHKAALTELERTVLEGKLRHQGDRVVDAPLEWTAVDRYDNLEVRRIGKLDRSRPIDASVALSLAVAGAVSGEGESCYETRRLVVV